MAQSEKIIISVELKDKGLGTGSKKAKNSIDDVASSTKKLEQATKDLEFQQSREARQLAEVQLQTQLATKANKDLAMATMRTSKATKEGRTQTGLNNAILVEAGRAASDAQYGMQGMSNNLGQLATLMSQHAQTQGGFVASFKTLAGSLMGSGGVLIALQLLISFLPKIQKFFEDMTESVDDFNNSLSLSTDNLTLLTQQLFDANVPLEEREALLEVLKKSDKEVYDVLTKGNKTSEEQRAILEKYIELKKTENEQSEVGKKLSEEINETQKKESELRDALSGKAILDSNLQLRRLKQFEEGTINQIGSVKRGSRAFDELYESELKNTKRRAEDERKGFQTDLDTLLEKRKGFNDKYLELQKQVVGLRTEIGLGEKEEEKKQEKKKVKALETNFSSRAKLSNNWFAHQVKNQMKLATTAKKMDEVELVDYRSKLEKKADLFLEHAEKLKDAQIKAEQIGGLAQGFIDSEIQAEEAKTAKLNNELKERLSNENLSADERKKIQAKIAANDMILAKKKNKLAEKQFKIDKALSISTTLINTFESAVKAYKSQLTADPTSPFRAILAGAKASAFGLAKVAMIAKQKFVPSAISAPSVGGDTGGGAGIGGAAPQAPAFNIVGSSGVNQLSDAIAGQGDRPVRTYVVASDVSTAQELDRNIIESASL